MVIVIFSFYIFKLLDFSVLYFYKNMKCFFYDISNIRFYFCRDR